MVVTTVVVPEEIVDTKVVAAEEEVGEGVDDGVEEVEMMAGVELGVEEEEPNVEEEEIGTVVE